MSELVVVGFMDGVLGLILLGLFAFYILLVLAEQLSSDFN
jgi:hypothetical protein